MKVNFKILVLGVISSCFLACDNHDENDRKSNANIDKELKVDNLYDANSNLKREFGKALMKSLNKSKALRNLIKNESLKMFDNDYEILYQLIKNKELESGKTVREIILENLSDEALLNKIELNNPTLTILVPKLPENSFSATIWDADSEIPKVAIRLTTSNDVPLINQDGTEEIFKAEYTPSFPVIVLKDNERIILSNSATGKNIRSSLVANINGLDYKFLDDCFDGSKKTKNATARTVNSSLLDDKIINAYNIYTGADVDGWQRDYIYYGITPGTPKGPFKYDFHEAIKSFALLGDPTAAYNKIADQTGDPRLPEQVVGNENGPLTPISTWAGGNYEFKIRIIINGKNGVGSEVIKYFNATVEDLFDFTYVKGDRTGFLKYWYIRDIKGLKKMDLNIPIFSWDLDQYASSIKIDIEEIDLTETIILTESRSVEYASNFGVELSGGYQDYIKIGLKYGTSQKVVKNSAVQRTFTQGNDLLGDVIINFADNIIINKLGNEYITREYSSGLYSIAVEPIRVQ
ncbi:hypothetical protein [Flavobacterium sp. SORGH_AS_0622]|uniref:hypothetical protein n=1 Tax=Flavobacterium sp. SORGH_AS_0622 TaxID=3041772 RepID=UPI002787DF1E|nr:hypothetical protein [Flavobacterium sp. SORGH_AS_0622]MDQ1167309.1 hypothetical protein [Flavobacterium sp. SORGH_AS_0622]